MTADELIAVLPSYPDWIHNSRMAHVVAQQRQMAAGRACQAAMAAAYARAVETEKTHSRTMNRVTLDQDVQAARAANDTARIAVRVAWMEYERISDMFKVALILARTRGGGNS